MSSHLNEVGYGYFKHLYRAWRISFILLVHGLFPNIWKTKASDELCKERMGDDATRAYMLKHMYGIDENKINMYEKMKTWEYPWDNKDKEEETPGIYERLSDRELAIIIEKHKSNK